MNEKGARVDQVSSVCRRSLELVFMDHESAASLQSFEENRPIEPNC